MEVLCVGTEKGVVEVRKVEIGDPEEAKETTEEDKEDVDEEAKEATSSDRRLPAGKAKPDFEEMIPVGGATLDVLVSLVGHTNR